MSVILRKKKLKEKYSLYLEIYVDGKRTYEFLKIYPLIKASKPAEKINNKELWDSAEIIRNQRERELMDNKYNLKPKGASIIFLDYFKRLTEERKKSPGNYGNWDSAYKILQQYYGNKLVMLSDLTDDAIADIKNYILNIYKTKSNVPLSRNAAVSYFNKVKACLNQAFDERLLIEKIGSRVKSIKAEETHRECLTQEEVTAVIAAECEFPILKNAFLFSVYTGLRWSDVNNLLWKNVVYTVDNGYSLRYTQQKTGSVENLPIPTVAIKYIGEPQDPEQRVFKGLKYSAWHNLKLQQWMMRAGIARNITFHTARHTYATLLLTKGADIYTVSKLLGHKHLSTTQIYAKVIDQKKIDTVNLLDS